MGRRRRWSKWGSVEREEGRSDPPRGGGWSVDQMMWRRWSRWSERTTGKSRFITDHYRFF